MSRLDVIGFGALNVDRLFRVDRLAKEEEESFIKDVTESCGGSAANATVGLARLGCKTGYIGEVANDREGDLLINDFQRENVDTRAVICSDKGRSGLVMGFVDKAGARALYINSGVNDLIKFDEVNVEYASKARFLHLSSFVGEESFRSQKKLLDELPEDVRISFDPGALYARKGFGGLESIIKRTYVLMPNSAELELLTGETDYCRGADYMIGKGARIVAVKLGGSGCYVTDGRERLLIEPFRVEVVDTTGAGDAFCAGFLYGLLREKNLYECGRLGNFVASRCVMKIGARTGLPFAKDLQFLG
jgi:ribokinase